MSGLGKMEKQLICNDGLPLAVWRQLVKEMHIIAAFTVMEWKGMFTVQVWPSAAAPAPTAQLISHTTSVDNSGLKDC